MNWLPIADTSRCDGEKRSLCHIVLDSFSAISSGERDGWDDLDRWCMHHLGLSEEHCTKRTEYLKQKMSDEKSLYEVLVLDMVEGGRRKRSILNTLPTGEVLRIFKKHGIEEPDMFDDDIPTREEVYYTSNRYDHVGSDAGRKKWNSGCNNRSAKDMRAQVKARQEWVRTNIISAPIGE